MLEIFFGWKKASKCKKLIKMAQCRLKLVKNKRCCIVKHLRDDVAELLKHGHTQTAFQRVEQIIMDESMVQLYDLLDQFCQFIMFHLPYIRKHRDCPNDINEAASTLIFSSARFGELPELMSLRNLFRDRYGQRFVITALELRPGNLVTPQIKENLYIKKVSDELKYKVLAEITSSHIRQGPLLLEYNYESAPGELEVYDVGRECPRKVVYIDDIEELVLPRGGKDENFQDQRLFVFKSREREIEYRLEYSKPYDEEGECEDDDDDIFEECSLRAITMPMQERRGNEEEEEDNKIIPYEQPRHIHPKLPDYDELEAKFKELKRANLHLRNG